MKKLDYDALGSQAAYIRILANQLEAVFLSEPPLTRAQEDKLIIKLGKIDAALRKVHKKINCWSAEANERDAWGG